jgi:hypothetical protein
MRAGGGKSKGSAFERKICKALSLLVSNGKRQDVFWRSAMSGGRATVQHARGVNIRQSGDICAVAPEGHAFADKWFIECKNVVNMNLASFLINNKGKLAKFWKTAKAEANKHNKLPMIIICSRGPILVITPNHTWVTQNGPLLTSHIRKCDITLFSDSDLAQK